MTQRTYHVQRLNQECDLTEFDCGYSEYNTWLQVHAHTSVLAGVCAVYVLIEQQQQTGQSRERVVGYYAISPAQVQRSGAPQPLARGWPDQVPAWRIGKLAIHRDLRTDRTAQWGRQLLRDALETIIRVADQAGGKVIVVDAHDRRLMRFYRDNGFTSTGMPDDLTLYLKVSTARKALR